MKVKIFTKEKGVQIINANEFSIHEMLELSKCEGFKILEFIH